MGTPRGLLVVLVGAVGCGDVTALQRDAAVVVDAPPDTAPPPDAAPDAPLPEPVSCREIKERDAAAPTGVFLIDFDGEGDADPVNVFCNMDMDGGGWMLAMSLAIDATGLTWTNLVPSFSQPLSPGDSKTEVLHHSVVGLAGVNQMMLMGGDRILKLYYPRDGGDFTANYRNLTERAAFRTENVPNDAPHTGGDRDPAGVCGHVGDACTTTDFALFKAADPSCPRDATNSHSVANCSGNCGSFGNCPGQGTTAPDPVPNCWFSGGTNATLVPNLSTCPVTSQAPFANYTTGTLTGTYTLWLR